MKYIALLSFALSAHFAFAAADPGFETWQCHTPEGVTVEFQRMNVDGGWKIVGADTYVQLVDGTRLNQEMFGGNADTNIQLPDGSTQWTGHDYSGTDPDVLVLRVTQTGLKSMTGSVNYTGSTSQYTYQMTCVLQ